MSLASVLHTALSGMSAATMTVDVAGNNLANSRTNGFKASRPVFVSQSPATHSSGGNTLQTGTGVRTAAVAIDFSQGPVVAPSASEGAASITVGAVELSNTDVGQSLIDLTLAEQQFRANADVFRTADSLLDELMLLRRGN